MADVLLNHLSKTFAGGVVAVSELDLQITDGELVVLVGPSGCGKSTLLRMIAGLERPTNGTVTIGGRVVNDLPPKDRNIAMVFQNYALYPHMTVFQNMAFGLKLRGTSKREITRRVTEAAEMLGLGALLERKPRALSGGQRQRVALGRAIVRNPDVFLFDEPLSNLDAKLRTQMRVEIAQLHAKLKTTMVYVTHDQTEAMTLGDRLVLLERGIVKQVASPVEIYRRPANRFAASFVGSPPMNFLQGNVARDGDQVRFTAPIGFSFTLPATSPLADLCDRQVTMGIRPEDIGSTAAEARTDAPRLTATIELIEPMGFEQHIHLRCGEAHLIRRADATQQYQTGATVAHAVLPSRIHFFDSDSGAALVGHR